MKFKKQTLVGLTALVAFVLLLVMLVPSVEQIQSKDEVVNGIRGQTVFDLYALLMNGLIIMKLIYMLAIAGLTFALVRKFSGFMTKTFNTEIAILVAVLAAIFSWFFIFATWINTVLVSVTGLVLFYFFGPTLLLVASFIINLIRD